MKIDIYNDGFSGKDLLGRSETGKRLSELVEKIDDPIVIALDGVWGSGKSFFLKCWVGEHLKKEHDHKAQTIYFDAFQHDFMDDPLISLTGVIAERFKEENDTRAQKAWQSAKSAAPFLGRTAIRAGLAIATAGASEIVGSTLDAGFKASTKEIVQAADAFWKKEDGKRAAMEAFKQALVDLTAPEKEGGPPNKLVIVIDELDRCRPDYALSLLEVIKHFFATENVHFVLGVNLKELENSVRARYGDRTDARKYLQKFINLTMGLSLDANASGVDAIESAMYLDKVSGGMGIDPDIHSELRKFLELPNIAATATIRDVQRVLSRVVLLPNHFGRCSDPGRFLVQTAIFLEIMKPDLYSKFRNETASQEDVFAFLGIKVTDKSFKRRLYDSIHVYLAEDPKEKTLEIMNLPIGRDPDEIKADLADTLTICIDRFSLGD